MTIASAWKPADPDEESLHWLRCMELATTTYHPDYNVSISKVSAVAHRPRHLARGITKAARDALRLILLTVMLLVVRWWFVTV